MHVVSDNTPFDPNDYVIDSAIIDSAIADSCVATNPILPSRAFNSQVLKRPHQPALTNSITRTRTRYSKKNIGKFDHLRKDPKNEVVTGEVKDYEYLIERIHRDDDDMLLYKLRRFMYLRKLEIS